MRQKQIIIAVSIMVVVLAIFGSLLFKKTPVTESKKTGTVTNVVDRPNQAEDGYYGFDVISSAGQNYSINATGYLNTPLSPDSRGEACVKVPRVKSGDKVEFNLPSSHDKPNAFGICYKKDLTGYYFNLN